MHGWFLPALGLALLGGAGFRIIQQFLKLKPWTATLLLLVMFVDVFTFNELQNPLAFARRGFDELYAVPQRALHTQLAALQPAAQRLYGPPLSAVGYRNHALQDHVETTYGYNPLELLGFADYADAAEDNPSLRDGLAATHVLSVSPLGGISIQSNPSALPLAFFARRITVVPDEASARVRLADLNPAEETIVVGAAPVESDPSASATVSGRGEDYVTVHYRTATSSVLRVAIASYPGWHASLNGTELVTLAVDDAFLGVAVPAGEGDVRMWYAPRFFWVGAALSSLALICSIAAVAGPRIRRTPTLHAKLAA
jgi:hypothetical protein